MNEVNSIKFHTMNEDQFDNILIPYLDGEQRKGREVEIKVSQIQYKRKFTYLTSSYLNNMND